MRRRREVRTSDRFHGQIDNQFLTTRTVKGRPSRSDFMAYVIQAEVLPYIAEHFDELTVDPDDVDRRYSRTDRYGWATFVIRCHGNPDGSVTLESIVFA